MDSDSTRQIVFIFVCLLFSAFFSLSETALMTLNKIRLRNMLDTGERGAEAVEKATKNPSKLLSSILVGNNFVNVMLSSIATALAISISGSNSIVLFLITLITTFLILIFGEIVPKTLASGNPLKYSLIIAPLINFFMAVLAPVVAVLNTLVNAILSLFNRNITGQTEALTESELKTMVNVSHEEGILKVEKKQMINNVFNFDDLQATDIMTPRTDMVSLSVNANYDEVLGIFRSVQYSRLPVYKDNTDHIVGILHFRDFIFLDIPKEKFSIKDYMRPPFFSYESKSISELFREMRSSGDNMVIILDEYGGTSGILTIEDLVVEIVGEISDEYGVEVDSNELNSEQIKKEEIKKTGNYEYLAGGGAKLDDINEMLNIRLESEDYDTIGGYVLGLIGDIPENKTEVSENGIKFIVQEVSKNRIKQIIIKVNQPVKLEKSSTFHIS